MAHKICRWNSIFSTDKLNIRQMSPSLYLLLVLDSVVFTTQDNMCACDIA